MEIFYKQLTKNPKILSLAAAAKNSNFISHVQERCANEVLLALSLLSGVLRSFIFPLDMNSGTIQYTYVEHGTDP